MQSMNEFPSPFWGSMQVPDQGPFFLEIFAGEAGLTEAVRKAGGLALPPIEIEVKGIVQEAVDLFDPQVLAHIHLLLEKGKIYYVHFGTPCSSFSIARKDDGGPPPLRDKDHLRGKPNLRPADQAKVEFGNLCADTTEVLVSTCNRYGVDWSIENPATSHLWSLPTMRALASIQGAQRIELDMCRFGSPHLKPTALLSSVDLSTLALRCDKDVRPHVHEPLTGSVLLDGKKIFKTRVAQVYPTQLCKSWAAVVTGHPSDPLLATFQWKLDPRDRKRPLGQPVDWSGHRQKISAEKAIAAGYQLKRSAVPPLFSREMDPGEAVQTALHMVHPFTVPPALEPDLQEALSMATKFPGQVVASRHAALHYWEQRAIALLPATERELSQLQDPWLRDLLRGVPSGQPLQLGATTHIALWREMLTAANCIDHFLLEEMLYGFPIVGTITRSYRWALLPAPETLLSVDGLGARAWEFTDKVLRNVKRSEVTENTQKIWDATMEDVAEGVTRGPFFSKEEVDEFVGTTCWIPTQRFEVVQKNKVRGVDSATTTGINMATTIVEKLDLPSTDVNVAALRWLKSESQGGSVQGWVLDERKAYRQIPILPGHRRWSVITLREPVTGKISFFVMIGHSFGLVAAVYNYNRRSAAITDVLRRIFWVAAFNFYDDKYGFELEQTCSSAFECARKVHWWLGAKFDAKKLQLCFDPTILGITYDLKGMQLKIKESRKEELGEEIDSILATGLLPPGQAGKLRGKLMFGSSQLWGKIGRAFLRSLSERQYAKFPRSDLNRAIQLSLEKWLDFIHRGPPRKIELALSRAPDAVIFTDGSFPDRKSSLKDPWIGGVVFAKGMRPVQFGCKVDQTLIDRWIPRKSQIAMVELFATVVALATFKEFLEGKWCLLFVDSEPVQGALVKGYSAKEDPCELVGIFWSIALDLKVNLYIDRVPTDANPSDPPSRADLQTGSALGWRTVDPIFPSL